MQIKVPAHPKQQSYRLIASMSQKPHVVINEKRPQPSINCIYTEQYMDTLFSKTAFLHEHKDLIFLL